MYELSTTNTLKYTGLCGVKDTHELGVVQDASRNIGYQASACNYPRFVAVKKGDATMKYQHTVMLDNPVNEVFCFVANGENNPRWRSVYLTSRHDPDYPKNGVGAVVRQYTRGPGGGASFPADYVVTEYDKNRVLGFRVFTGPLRPEGRFRFSPEGQQRTAVTMELWWEPKGFLDHLLIAPMVSRLLPKDVSSLNNLRWTAMDYTEEE